MQGRRILRQATIAVAAVGVALLSAPAGSGCR
jgi:hypothetical protein